MKSLAEAVKSGKLSAAPDAPEFGGDFISYLQSLAPGEIARRALAIRPLPEILVSKRRRREYWVGAPKYRRCKKKRLR